MLERVKCKVCGNVMEGGNVPVECPVCWSYGSWKWVKKVEEVKKGMKNKDIKETRKILKTYRDNCGVSAFNKQVGGEHYKGFKIEPMEFFIANRIPYAEAAVMKYVLRYREKNGVEDLEKAIHVLEMLKEKYVEEMKGGKK